MANTPAEQSTWFGHPPQLARLFVTEMWERFGFYGMRALLTLYLAQHFMFNDKITNGLYGAFTALVYLTPLFGGLLADRYLGYKRSVKFGAIMMSIGYFVLCFGGDMAKPFLKLGDQKHTVTIEKGVEEQTIDGKLQKVEVTKRFADIGGTRYQIESAPEGAIKLTSPADTKVIEKGTFAFDGERNPFWVNIMFMALTMVIVGNGFFKPNISTIVGSLYDKGDPRRDGGFTIFYMGINIGSMISQFMCPLFQEWFGFWAGFLLAAFGMLFAWMLIQFDGGRLKGYGEPPADSKGKALPIFAGAILTIPLIWFLMHNTMISAEAAADAATTEKSLLGFLWALPILGKILLGVFLVSIIGIPIWAFKTAPRQDAEKMVVAMVLVVFSVVFWTLFEQAGSSLTLYADRNTDLNVLGLFNMPAAQTQIFNPLFIVILAPLMSWLWIYMSKKNCEPSMAIKFAIGLVLVGLGFLALVYGSKFADNQFKVGLVWLVLAYLLHSIGELCLSPVGLSMITKLSIAKIVGLMMGVWFLCTSVAQYVAGIVATFASTESVAGEATDPKLSLETYVSVFQTIGIGGIVAGAVLLVMSPFLKRMMHGVK
jgi:proton-dependent oligopeptide transporter, POT family